MPSSTNFAAAGERVWQLRIVGRLRQRLRSDLLHNAGWMLSGQSLQLAGRFAYFVIVAHVLGPAEYGTFVACTALVATMSPFASWGTGHVMIKYVARNRNVLPAYFGNALLVTIAVGSLLTLFLLLVRSRVLPVSATAAMLAAVAIADLLGTQMIGICLQVFQAVQQGRRFAQILTLSTGVRFIAALVLVGIAPSAIHWAYLYAVSAVIATIAGILAVCRYCARPRAQVNVLFSSMREGFHFATCLASQSVYDDIDKTMLARLSTVESAAIYAVAYRFIEAAMMPIRSLAAATYPEFFRRGALGVTSAYGFARRILRRSVLYGIATAIALFVAAALVPLIMGRAYRDSALALRWLCLLPVIKSVHSFLSDTLTGANYQWQRSSAQILVAGFNVLINLWIIRAFAWRGAAWSSLMTDSLLMILLYVIIRWHLRREQVARVVTVPQPTLAVGGE